MNDSVKSGEEPKEKVPAGTLSKLADIATIVAALAVLYGLWVTWEQFNRNLEKDRNKDAMGYFSDYVKFVRELEVKASENARPTNEHRAHRVAVAPTEACTALTGASASEPTQPASSAPAASAASASDIELTPPPPMTANSVSYVLHLAESIFVLKSDDQEWVNTAAGIVCDNAASIALVRDWRCSAMREDFRKMAQKHALICCVGDKRPECQQR